MKTSQKVMASIVAVAVFSIAIAPIAPSAFADDPLGSNGVNWGAATAFYAQNFDMGEHSSDQDNPRQGLGNLKKAFGGDWCALLFQLNVWAEEDGIGEQVLSCEEQNAE